MNGNLNTIVLLVLLLISAMIYIAYLENKISKLNDKIALFQKEHDAVQKCLANLRRASMLYANLGKQLGAFKGTLDKTKNSLDNLQETQEKFKNSMNNDDKSA